MGERNRRVIRDYGLPEVRAHMAELYAQELAEGEAR